MLPNEPNNLMAYICYLGYFHGQSYQIHEAQCEIGGEGSAWEMAVLRCLWFICMLSEDTAGIEEHRLRLLHRFQRRGRFLPNPNNSITLHTRRRSRQCSRRGRLQKRSWWVVTARMAREICIWFFFCYLLSPEPRGWCQRDTCDWHRQDYDLCSFHIKVCDL